MDYSFLEQVATDFALGTIESVTQNEEGVLNTNYLVRTSTGTYFIKSVREKLQKDLPYIAEAERFMHERGIPAVCMLSNKNGGLFSVQGSFVYSVYPFTESDRLHQYSDEDYARMGALLGRIHQAGGSDIPEPLQTRWYRERDPQQTLEELRTYRAQILARDTREPVDEEFLTYIDLKTRLIEHMTPSPALAHDTLAHGDYHARNLLIHPETRDIIGVCDWEKAAMTPRAYELARSALYVAFSEDYAGKDAAATARAFIAGYQSTYPIDTKEMKDGFSMRLNRILLSVWIEEHYYVRKDPRANKFVPHEIQIITDFLEGDMLSTII